VNISLGDSSIHFHQLDASELLEKEYHPNQKQ
jgi:hypothetical protein